MFLVARTIAVHALHIRSGRDPDAFDFLKSTESGDGMRGIMDRMRYRQWRHLQYDFIQQLRERAEKEPRRGVLRRELNCLSSLRS